MDRETARKGIRRDLAEALRKRTAKLERLKTEYLGHLGRCRPCTEGRCAEGSRLADALAKAIRQTR